MDYAFEFSGSDFIEEKDQERLTNQHKVILGFMRDGLWRTLREIEHATGYPHASISAQLRNLRKASFGGHTINRRRTGDERRGLFEYQLIVNHCPGESREAPPRKMSKQEIKGWQDCIDFIMESDFNSMALVMALDCELTRRITHK